MKNLLIYTGPNKKFGKEDSVLARIQIDNSFDLGWKKEDILLVTDFEYEYNSVRSFVIKGDIYYDFDINASKLPVIVYLLNQGIIQPEEIYWCHDFDAYELNKINENDLGLKNFDLGLVHYFYKPEWQFGSFFFKSDARDILELLDTTSRAKPHSSRNNEKTLTKLIKNNSIDNKRYKRLNVTYSIMKRCLGTVYNEAAKPIKVLHFRPSDPKDARMPDTALNMFMYGKNSLKIPLMSDRLIKIFNRHGIK
ncbi:hypothetical protein HYW44_04735 [Candidatus Daviesbacteria bacterium]|nr:hypothetical protein [Candidatus Daviesbacteria bacterium]